MVGYGDFAYRVVMIHLSADNFVLVRQWCVDSYGPTLEYDTWEHSLLVYPELPVWSWQRGYYVDKFRCNILLRTEEAATMFKLKWC